MVLFRTLAAAFWTYFFSPPGVCLLSMQGNNPVEHYNNLALRSQTHKLAFCIYHWEHISY